MYLLDESQCKEVVPPVEPEKSDNTTGLSFNIQILVSHFFLFLGIVLTILAFLLVTVLSAAYLFYKRQNSQPPKLATQIITRPMQGGSYIA